MNDDSIAKTIAELKVDITKAMTPLSQLQTQFESLDKQIGKTQAGMAGIGKPAATGAKGMTAAATATKQFNKEIDKQSVLASQWERKISWFISGTAFYGGIRAIQATSKALMQLESDMTVIARTTDDATFNFNKMRDELINIGKDYGRAWESVSQVATEWTKAGYNVADTLELTRTSLLALNVADMTVQQATSGLIAIMSQWDLQAQDLELVIDKLNITSDRYAITTGDLVEAVLRSSGAARAANISFEELVGMITATRVASGRAGGEIGKLRCRPKGQLFGEKPSNSGKLQRWTILSQAA